MTNRFIILLDNQKDLRKHCLEIASETSDLDVLKERFEAWYLDFCDTVQQRREAGEYLAIGLLSAIACDIDWYAVASRYRRLFEESSVSGSREHENPLG
ncbi:hypothetical protein [Chroococcidiopsis sp.]|uniref:hypothetical protein n=1 Tax=Chroococcidiopsis sp. TaxID=3088168 RepID=UPI003F3CE64B